MTVHICPNCQTRFTVAFGVTDFVCNCGDMTDPNKASSKEDVLVVGAYEDYSGSGAGPTNVYLGTGTIGADASTRIEFNSASDYITFTTNAGTQRLYIDSAGILAIGGNDTESWNSVAHAVEFYQAAIYAYNNDNVIGLACNAYYSPTGWKYKATNAAGRYQMLDGIHYFYVEIGRAHV